MQVILMPKPTITIPLDPETARTYESAPPERKRQMEALLGLWLRELASADYPSLQETLAACRRSFEHAIFAAFRRMCQRNFAPGWDSGQPAL